MQPPFPSPTATWHNSTYDAINPSDRALRQDGKTIVVTGAGSGIGRATAIAFAEAGATRLILIGRTESRLKETAKLIGRAIKVEILPASVTDEVRMREIVLSVGAWDILILDAAPVLIPGLIVDTSLQDWWQHYETDVKSIVIASQNLIPTAKLGAALYAITAGALVMPPAHTPGLPTYLSSKVARSKVMGFVAAENPHLLVCTVHPGMIETDVFRSSGADPKQLSIDDGKPMRSLVTVQT